MRQLSLNEQSALNIIGSIILVLINVAINFVLSPFIVKNLGVEANGYITLANNFVSYIALITTALNSMAGRFILISYRQKDQISANEYYSSVLLGDWILVGILIIPVCIFITNIDTFINIPSNFLYDTRILFIIVFFNFFIQLCLPQWRTATYCTNNLYLRSLSNAISGIVRAIVIFLLFAYLPPHSYYIGIAATAMTIVGITIEYFNHKRLMPELIWKISLFRFAKVKELISSGIWNTVSKCGNLLLEGLDILIANIFISPISAGILALSKIIPNMINQITGTISTTFGPRLTYLYVDGKKEEMIEEIKNNITIISIISNIPIGIFIIYGIDFFKKWIPSQDPVQLTILSSIALLGMLILGLSQCYVNIFGIVNKLKLNSLVVVVSGCLNLFITIILLKTTNLGIYSIVCSSTIISIARVFLFIAPYAAKCIETNKNKFIWLLIKGASNVVIPCVIGFIIKLIIPTYSWCSLIISILTTCIISIVIYYYFVLNNNQRKTILAILHIKK